MIGPTKLGTIREQLRGAIAATTDDPLQWLEQRFSAPKGSVPSGSGPSEVLESLHASLRRAIVGRVASGEPLRRSNTNAGRGWRAEFRPHPKPVVLICGCADRAKKAFQQGNSTSTPGLLVNAPSSNWSPPIIPWPSSSGTA